MVSDEFLSDVSMTVISVVPPLLVNVHSMVTHAKAVIFKPRVLAIEVSKREPYNITETFIHESWSVLLKKSMMP